MTQLLTAVEQSAFSIWLRESGSVWSYTGLVFFHTVGMALVAGLNVAIALRLLGVAPDVPVAPFERFYRIIWAGFWINVMSGLCLIAADPVARLSNPVLYVKLAIIAVAMTVMVKTRQQVFRRPPITSGPLPSSARLLAWASLVLWAGAITAGRLMTYFAVDTGATLSRLGG